MASLKSILVKSQHVSTAINLMLRSWAAKVTAAQGSKQLANSVTEDLVSSYSAETWDGVIPSWSGGDTSSEKVARVNLFSGVMTMEKAFACVDDAANDCVARYKAQRESQKRKRVRWRWWVSESVSLKVMARERLTTRAALQALAMKKRRRVGRQRISTTRRNKVPESGRFVFGGRTAVRMPRGRPALPLDTWLARYNARKSRRQQRNATAIRRNRGIVKVPATRYRRPDVVELLGV